MQIAKSKENGFLFEIKEEKNPADLKLKQKALNKYEKPQSINHSVGIVSKVPQMRNRN